MIKIFGHSDTTGTNELYSIGKKLFGSKFLGVFPQDRLPDEIYNKPSKYAIINNHTSGMSGEHWVAIAGLPNSTKILIFDSFGRASKTLLPLLKQKKIIDTDSDAEQKIIQMSCGQFSMGFLIFFNKYGWKNARLI